MFPSERAHFLLQYKDLSPLTSARSLKQGGVEAVYSSSASFCSPPPFFPSSPCCASSLLSDASHKENSRVFFSLSDVLVAVLVSCCLGVERRLGLIG